MKTILSISTLIIATVLLFNGCDNSYDCQEEYVYYSYTPIYLKDQQLKDSVKLLPPQPLKNLGKIYLKDNFIYLNQTGKGVHIIDNSDPKNPKNIAFLYVLGNYDIEAKNNYLYLDSFIDLVIFDITDPYNIKEVNRKQKVFLTNYQNSGLYLQDSGMVIDTKVERKVGKVDCDNYGYQGNCIGCAYDAATSPDVTKDVTKSEGSSGSGVGGSLARFTITNDYLYTVDNSNLHTFNISDNINPIKESEVVVNWSGVETIFPYENHLYLGSQQGMYIYNINNPKVPTFTSTFSHIRSCDPVIVRDTFAYVTLRNGNTCTRGRNELQIINIANKSNPYLVKTIPLSNPIGLSIQDDCLFVAEKENGLKSIKLKDIFKEYPNITNYADIKAFEVIAYQSILYLISDDSFNQYVSNCEKNTVTQLNSIQIVNE